VQAFKLTEAKLCIEQFVLQAGPNAILYSYNIQYAGLVSCRLPVLSGSASKQVRRVRAWRSVDRGVLREAVQPSALGCPPPPSQDDDMSATYDTVLRDIADCLAPEHVVHTRLRPSSPWFDADCRAAGRHCCRLERRYHRSYSNADRRSWITAARSKLTLFQTKKNAYWLAHVQEDS